MYLPWDYILHLNNISLPDLVPLKSLPALDWCFEIRGRLKVASRETSRLNSSLYQIGCISPCLTESQFLSFSPASQRFTTARRTTLLIEDLMNTMHSHEHEIHIVLHSFIYFQMSLIYIIMTWVFIHLGRVHLYAQTRI